jgi:hypothetical protein
MEDHRPQVGRPCASDLGSPIRARTHPERRRERRRPALLLAGPCLSESGPPPHCHSGKFGGHVDSAAQLMLTPTGGHGRPPPRRFRHCAVLAGGGPNDRPSPPGREPPRPLATRYSRQACSGPLFCIDTGPKLPVRATHLAQRQPRLEVRNSARAFVDYLSDSHRHRDLCTLMLPKMELQSLTGPRCWKSYGRHWPRSFFYQFS